MPIPATPVTPPATGGSNFINSLLPGMSGLTNSAAGNIQNLLSGLPSVSATRQSNAYFGAGSGMPGSDFVRNRGYDLYGQKAAANRETGLQDLLQTIGSYSQPTLQAQGQANQVSQFGQSLAQNQSQFGQTLGLDEQKLAQQGGQFSQDLSLQQQSNDFAQKQAALTTSPEYLQMLANLKNYGSAATNPVGSPSNPIKLGFTRAIPGF